MKDFWSENVEARVYLKM